MKVRSLTIALSAEMADLSPLEIASGLTAELISANGFENTWRIDLDGHDPREVLEALEELEEDYDRISALPWV